MEIAVPLEVPLYWKALFLPIVPDLLILSMFLLEKWSDSFVSSTLLALLGYAAKVIGELGKRLVLIVDVLDEDRSGERELSYILRRLPKNNISNLVIILSSRPNPNMQDAANLDSNHPARYCTMYLLTQSPHAKVQQELADKALEEIHDKEQSYIELIAFLAIAEGGLSVEDLSGLTGMLPIKIRRLFEQPKTGRIFQMVRSENLVLFDDSPKRYKFGHEEIRQQALSGFVGGETKKYLESLSTWYDGFVQQNWKSRVPDYLMTDYLRLLANNRQWERVADILINYDFISLVSRVSLSCVLCFQLINETIGALSKVDVIDFVRIGLLSESRSLLALRDSKIPTELPILFANIGRYDEALQMTETMSESDRLLCRSQIVVIFANNHIKDRAVELAQKVISEIPLERYLPQRSNQHEVDYARYLSNCATALVLCGKKEDAEAAFNYLMATLSADERFRHGKHEMMFFHSLREIVIATAKAGDIEGALREVELLSFDWQTKGFTLVHIGVLQALQGNFAGALKTVAEAYITNYHNDGTCNENGRHGNEHITLECVKILMVIEMLSRDNAPQNGIVNTVLEIATPNNGKIECFTFPTCFRKAPCRIIGMNSSAKCI